MTPELCVFWMKLEGHSFSQTDNLKGKQLIESGQISEAAMSGAN